VWHGHGEDAENTYSARRKPMAGQMRLRVREAAGD
jgi:hypothetical protein